MVLLMQEATLPLPSQTEFQSGPAIDSPKKNVNNLSRITRSLVAGLLLAVATAAGKAEAGDPTGGPETRAFIGTGALVIAGGGVLPPEIRKHFVELGGGKDAKVVIIPSASEDADDPEKQSTFYWEGLQESVATVDIFHTRDHAKADCNIETSKLDTATAVWFSGGKQGPLADAYRERLVIKKVRAVFERGGVIGGTSAGAAVMTKIMIENQKKHEDGTTELVIGEGFDFLPGAVVDQHFQKRKRSWRLDRVLQQHPTLVGLGIDEETALVVRRNSMRVIGNSTVSVRSKVGEIKVLNHGATENLADFGMPVALNPMETAEK